MKKLTVYTKPGCIHCANAKDYLRSLEIPFVEIDIAAHPAARDQLIAEGHKTMPVIYTGDSFIPGGSATLKTMRKDEILERLQD